MADLENLTTTLEGSIVTLEPLRPEHAEELWEAARANGVQVMQEEGLAQLLRAMPLPAS